MSVLHVLPDAGSAAREAAGLFCTLAGQAVQERGVFRVALSGGGSPLGLYQILSKPPYSGRVKWDNVVFFWGDERCVAPDNSLSNYGGAASALLEHVPASAYRIKGELGPTEAAAIYEQELRDAFGVKSEMPVFDLVLLGMGRDGHTASIMPGSGAMDETTRLAVGVEGPALDVPRVTLTLGVFNAARAVAFLVTGGGKARVLREVLLGGEAAARYPAALVRPVSGELHWFLDMAAASALR